MDTFTKSGAILLGVFYLICVGFVFFASSGNADDHCTTFAPGPATTGVTIRTESESGISYKHIESRDGPCFFLFTKVLAMAEAIAITPSPYVILMGCGIGGSCSEIVVVLAFGINFLLYVLVGALLGKGVSLVVQQRKRA